MANFARLDEQVEFVKNNLSKKCIQLQPNNGLKQQQPTMAKCRSALCLSHKV